MRYFPQHVLLCTSTVHDQSANIYFQGYLRILWILYVLISLLNVWTMFNLQIFSFLQRCQKKNFLLILEELNDIFLKSFFIKQTRRRETISTKCTWCAVHTFKSKKKITFFIIETFKCWKDLNIFIKKLPNSPTLSYSLI